MEEEMLAFEIYVVPKDPCEVEEMYDALCECSALHPQGSGGDGASGEDEQEDVNRDEDEDEDEYDDENVNGDEDGDEEGEMNQGKQAALSTEERDDFETGQAKSGKQVAKKSRFEDEPVPDK